MRFYNRGTLRMSGAYLSKRKTIQRILMTNLGLNSTDSEQVLDMNKTIINNFPRHRIINSCLICQEHNIDIKPLEDFWCCLSLCNYKLEHRINIYKDIGVSNLNVSSITRIRSLFRKSVHMFKKDFNIPPEQNIAENILSKLGNHPIDSSLLESLSDKLSMRNYYQRCLLHCKKQFDLPDLDDKILLNKFMVFKSISMIWETLKILRINVGYDNELIMRFPQVITASADNIRSLLDNFKDTGLYGIPIDTVLKQYPYIIFEDANNMKQLLMSFQRYEIPDEYILKSMKIFEIGNDVFLERIERIKRHPHLHVWCKHPRVLQLVLHRYMVDDRIGYLQMIDRLKWARLQTVLCEKQYIEKYTQYNSGRLISKKYLKHLFAKELGSDKVDLVTELTKHQHWKTAGFIDIEQMLKYLKTKFEIDEICHNIQIVLYRRSVVEKLLVDLKRRYSESTEISFTNSQYLSLCLYTLEKENEFTGDSIWVNGHNIKESSDLLKDQNTTESIDNIDNKNNFKINNGLYN